ncbi:kinesin-like protein KIN-4A [Tanacetum coccineum]
MHVFLLSLSLYSLKVFLAIGADITPVVNEAAVAPTDWWLPLADWCIQSKSESEMKLERDGLRHKIARLEAYDAYYQVPKGSATTEGETGGGAVSAMEGQSREVKKDSRKNEFELNKLNALYQRRTQVLKRKSEEAARATKKLKELLESRKAMQKGSKNQPQGRGRSDPATDPQSQVTRRPDGPENYSRRRNGCQEMLQSRNTVIAAQFIGLYRSSILCSGVLVSGMTTKM